VVVCHVPFLEIPLELHEEKVCSKDRKDGEGKGIIEPRKKKTTPVLVYLAADGPRR
jgi:hypothetical protein